MIDVFFIAMAVKLLHIVFLWFMFFLTEKIALQEFIDYVYVQGKAPPNLEWTVLRVFVADFFFCCILLGGVYVYMASLGETIVGGQQILWAIAADLLLAWKLSFVAVGGIAWIAQSQSCCRYKDDGLRGTRAFCYTSLILTILICLPPYYLIL